MLRGINVSGQKKIKMADLKSLYELLGFQNVVTYIQSGNVIFDSSVSRKNEISSMIERSIQRRYNFSVPVIVRTCCDFSDVIENCPFGKINLAENGTKILVTFLSVSPKKSNITDFLNYVVPPEKIIIKGKVIYLHCPNGYGKSRLSNSFIENKLEVKATTRNWKSINKLHELSVE